jgi:hypothetical protein
MALFKLSTLALIGLTLAACQQEAGFDAAFPPIGGTRPMTMPDAGMPTDLTPTDPINDGSTEALSNAVNEALNATEANATVASVAPNSGDGLASDSGVLVLSEQSQAEQLRLRTADAEALAAAAAQRVVIQPGQMPAEVAGVNIITYARETTNSVGDRLFRRPSIRRTSSPRSAANLVAPTMPSAISSPMVARKMTRLTSTPMATALPAAGHRKPTVLWC